nr:DUF1256 domain-containing protein [Clostridium algidicarnis]
MVKPIHALNMTKYITEIKNTHPQSKVIVIDVSLCDEDEIGMITIRNGSIQPSNGIGNNCGEVGEISIRGYVAPRGIKVIDYDTDLCFNSAMAYTIAKGLKEAFR